MLSKMTFNELMKELEKTETDGMRRLEIWSELRMRASCRWVEIEEAGGVVHINRIWRETRYMTYPPIIM
jgi:hypothetical protein